MAVLGHHYNETAAQSRAVMAQARGLDPTIFATPYPGTQQSSTVVNKGIGAVAAVVIALSTAIGGAGLAFGLPAVLKSVPAAQSPATPTAPTSPPITTTPPSSPPATKPTAPYYWDEVDWKTQPGQPDTETGRRHYRMMPDGTVQQSADGKTNWTNVK